MPNFLRAELDPLNHSLEQLSRQLGRLEGEPKPLDGGITNRNYRARFAGRDVVIRLPGKDTELLEIDRGAERLANEIAARAGVGPGVAAMLERPPCLVTNFVEGRPLSAEELRQPQALAEVAAALRRVHDCGEELRLSFSPFRIVKSYAERVTQRGSEPPPAYAGAARIAARIEAALRGAEHEAVPCHDDLLAANFIESEKGIRIVDWEYAGMNDRYFDLGNFAANNELGPAEESAFLDAYFGEPCAEGRLAALRLMRFMSDFREAMWGAVQSTISDLDFDFDDYAARHFERMREIGTDAQLEIWLQEASGTRG